MNPAVSAVTDRIIERSRAGRAAYLDLIARERDAGLKRPMLGCANLAHGYAGTEEDRDAMKADRGMNIGIVTSYNDMLSAHAVYYRYPEQMKVWAREVGATAQVAGGVPAMCDGVTQGYPGMELSLFSRDTIALSTAIALSHGMFEGAALLGICDKIVPGLLMGALRFGHLPMILIPGGPMRTGMANKAKAAVREALCRGEGRARGTARCRDRRLSFEGDVHLLRHRQHQPDDDGGDGPPHARRRLRQSGDQAAPGIDARGDAPVDRRSAPTATTGRSGCAWTRRRSSTRRWGCSRPGARPIT